MHVSMYYVLVVLRLHMCLSTLTETINLHLWSACTKESGWERTLERTKYSRFFNVIFWQAQDTYRHSQHEHGVTAKYLQCFLSRIFRPISVARPDHLQIMQIVILLSMDVHMYVRTLDSSNLVFLTNTIDLKAIQAKYMVPHLKRLDRIEVQHLYPRYP